MQLSAQLGQPWAPQTPIIPGENLEKIGCHLFSASGGLSGLSLQMTTIGMIITVCLSLYLDSVGKIILFCCLRQKFDLRSSSGAIIFIKHLFDKNLRRLTRGSFAHLIKLGLGEHEGQRWVSKNKNVCLTYVEWNANRHKIMTASPTMHFKQIFFVDKKEQYWWHIKCSEIKRIF